MRELADRGIVGEKLRDVLPHDANVYYGETKLLYERADTTRVITTDDIRIAAEREGFTSCLI